ncbi:DUF2092 domain-containing protein [Methylomicrobium sp. Wu6]|uniref:DUF2092 domain-containing protein n=1 Tax=Methylomicrobium sp. Wu6 TaxID=3107928 RepID=UPI002DD65310|nr:DUF2092 domain-containing protein [Methylomicrobium sp. Wu6]MEC4748124.1 DUF2092 domain-containing protein [Methylomicrobium sp. Wu6]
MKKYNGSLKRSILCAITPLIMVGCAQEQAAVRPQPSAAVAPATKPVAATERDAKKILMTMAEYLAKTPRFSVNLRGSYEVVQASGQKIEFGEIRRIIVSRPNGLRVEVEHSDGEKHLVLYDGKQITTFTPTQNVYAQVSKPGGIDEAVTYFLKDLHMRLPLAALLLSRFPAELDNRTQSLDYVETTVIDGTPAHHLAGRTETVDYQVWIPAGAQPLPLLVVLTYKNAEGQPSFRAKFSDWNLAPQIPDNQFVFTPPEGARKIAFLAELPELAVQGTAKPLPAGEKK